MQREADLIKQIIERLKLYHHFGQVLWWSRLNSGRIKTYIGTWLMCCDKGTPDFLALIRSETGNIIAVFIEAKSEFGQLRKDQKAFMNKYKYCNDIQVLLVRDISGLTEFIDMYGVDKTKEMPSEL